MASAGSRVCSEVKSVGISRLYAPEKEEDIVADIVFVHGLGGHPRRTWQYGPHEGDNAQPGNTRKSAFWHLWSRKAQKKRTEQLEETVDSCYWPHDLVPGDFEYVRVLTYGYDSQPTHFYKSGTNNVTISQHGRDLLERITNARAGCESRPLFFVAHSLGGILVEDAIVESRKYSQQPAMQAVFKSTKAIFFFGTPHQGSSAADWGVILSNIMTAIPGSPDINSDLLKKLAPDSEKLDNLNKDFNDILDADVPPHEKIVIHSFQEGKGMTALSILNGKVVPDRSAAFHRRAFERISTVDKNHRDMCRLASAEDPTYETFKARLSVLLEDLTRSHQEQRSQQSAHTYSDLLASLDFEGRCVRENQLWSLDSDPKAFEWLWESPFASWLMQDSPTFWICGKPASGKSTLVDYLRRSSRAQQILWQNHAQQWDVIYHFFDFRGGKGIRNNLEGYMRSLLYQLIAQANQRGDMLKSQLDDRTHSWTLGSLREELNKRIGELERPTLIFLDGLDEYEDSHLHLIDLIVGMGKPNLKICLSSRPEPIFVTTLRGYPFLRMEEYNGAGIRLFVDKTLRTFAPEASVDKEDDLGLLANSIVDRAGGVFLWARFAIFELAHAYAEEGDDFDALSERLLSIPEDLENIYVRIFSKLKPERRHQAGLFLQLLCSSKTVLTVTQLATASKIASAVAEDSICLPFMQINAANFEKKLLSSTGGLLETYWLCSDECRDGYDMVPFASSHGFVTVSFEPIRVVSLIHRTVRTYLDRRGWEDIFSNQDRSIPNAEEMWLKICALHFRPAMSSQLCATFEASILHQCHAPVRMPSYVLDETDNMESADLDERDRSRSLPLLEYAAQFMPSHARELELQHNTSSYELIYESLDHAFLRFFLSIYTIACSRNKIFWDDENSLDVGRGLAQNRMMEAEGSYPTEPLHLALAYGLSLYLADHLRHSFELPEKERIVQGAVDFPIQNKTELLRKLHTMSFGGENRLTAPEYAVKIFHRKMSLCHQLRALEIYLDYYPAIDDDCLALALLEGNIEVVRCLLARSPTEKTMLRQPRSAICSMDRYVSIALPETIAESDGSHRLECRKLWDQIFANDQLRPMWYVALRRYNYATAWQREHLLEHYLRRGEELDGMCSTLGTVLHAACLDGTKNGAMVFLKAGMDPLISGEFGNVLEFYWKVGHLSLQTPYYGFIRHLLELGVPNQRRDPNGCLPSRAWMLYDATQSQICYNCKRRFQAIYLGAGRYLEAPELDMEIHICGTQGQLKIFQTIFSPLDTYQGYDPSGRWVAKPAT